MRGIIILIVFAALAVASSDPIKGFVLTSYAPGEYSSPKSSAAVQAMAATGIQAVEIMATWFVDNSVNSTRIYSSPSRSPTDADVLKAVADAHGKGLVVYLKPHIDCLDGVWRANIGTQYTSEEQWADFFSNYTSFVQHFVQLAKEGGVTGGFNVATELDGTWAREKEWRAIIAGVRSTLPGVPLWVGPNWEWERDPGYTFVKFWDALDYLAVDMYRPLSVHPDPTLNEAISAWEPVISNLSAFYEAQGGNKKFLFAEIGFASFREAAVAPQNCCVGPADYATQSILYESFFATVFTQAFFGGVFWWAWAATTDLPSPCSTNFDILGKPAQKVVEKYYKPPKLLSTPPSLIYSDGKLGTGYENWSWGARVNLSSSEHPYPNHSLSASVEIVDKYGALAIHSTQALDLSGFTSLQFDMLVTGNQSILNNAYALQASLCACWDCANNATCPPLPAVRLAPYSPTPCTMPLAWETGSFTLPLHDLLGASNVTKVGKLEIGGPISSFFIDNIKLV